MTRDEKLQALKALRDPSAAVLSHIQMLKGDPGVQGPQGEVGPMGPRGADGQDGANGAQGPQGERGPQGKAGRHGIDGRDGKDGKNGRDGISPAVETIVAMVREELTKTPIEYKDIKGAPDLTSLAELVKFLKLGGFRGGGGSSSSSGGTPQMANLSSQCDGSNLVFTIPAFTTILSLIGSDAPNIYNPAVDFTATGTTLTLVGVNAPSSGATLILNYV